MADERDKDKDQDKDKPYTGTDPAPADDTNPGIPTGTGEPKEGDQQGGNG